MSRQRDGLPTRKKKNQIIAEYPAHLHINLMPGYQGLGLGTRLMNTFETHLRDFGIRGIHLTTSNKNFKAIPFYSKMGFEIIYQSEAVQHSHFEDLRFLVFAKKLLDSVE
jgi:ribosomal protein S18 acetylase RimI-like enzyme